MDEYENLYSQLVDEFTREFPTEKGNYPTAAWIAGVFKRLYDFKNIEQMMKNPKLPRESVENFEKIMFMKNFGEENGLLTKSDHGFVVKTDRGSKFIQHVASNIEQYKKFDAHRTTFGRSPEYKNTWYTVLAAANQADKEWADSLSEGDQRLLKLYSELTPKSFSFLKGLLTKNIDKKKYTHLFNSFMEHNPDEYEMLSNLSLIRDNQINGKLLRELFSFLGNAGYSKLKSFNREISQRIDRSAADKALNKNYVERNLSDSPRANALGARAREFILGLPEDFKKEIEYVARTGKIKKGMIPKFISNGIIDEENKVSEFGKLIFSLIKSGVKPESAKDEHLNRKIKSQEMKDQMNLPPKSRDKNPQAVSRKNSFKDFLNRH